uniref:Translocation protein SEC62 n=1 Tax=Amphora coffeiformis TaxID=265554 RepID=A0A7S3L1N7_9STRA|mmetsp:Transcript_6109/g.12247  ORF Transcript_6109/g.12247 Transcript_6109/m.12247 type:complete len:333 (+) Transcript_6109:119-1117(+)|eukprot:scaffold15735_cov152-Amphora_coffeaeformis.AAC.7
MSDKKEETKVSKSLAFYQEPGNLKKLCDFLRSRQGPALREAVLMDQRVYYLKGEKLVNFLVEPKKGTKWPNKLPRFESRLDAIAVCKDLCKQQFIVRSEKQGKGVLALSSNRAFDETGYFTWIYEGDKLLAYLMSGGLAFFALFCILQPIWPTFLKVFVWYLSVSFLLFVFGLITVRGFLFLMVWIIGFEFWIFPNLFDESLGFVESFIPFFSFEPTKPGQLVYRLGVGAAFFSFCWWAVTQPSEFDGYVAAQGDFLKDLYAGTLLSDMSQADKENIDKPKYDSLDDLLKALDEEIEKADIMPEEPKTEEEKLDSLLEDLVENEEVILSDEE